MCQFLLVFSLHLAEVACGGYSWCRQYLNQENDPLKQPSTPMLVQLAPMIFVVLWATGFVVYVFVCSLHLYLSYSWRVSGFNGQATWC